MKRLIANRQTIVAATAILATVVCGCSSDPGSGANQDSDTVAASQGEEVHESGEHDEEGRGEHARDRGGNEEGEELGTELSLTERYDKVRNGARLVLAYDAKSNSFKGTVENTTKKTLKRVRVEVHLSNGTELGPTIPGDLKPGEKRDVELSPKSKGFNGWTAHPEVGNEEHAHDEGGEHGRRERGEHSREGRGEHGSQEQSEHDREGKSEH